MEKNNSNLIMQGEGMMNSNDHSKPPHSALIQEEIIMDQFQDRGFGIDQSLHLEFTQSQMSKMREGIKKLFQLIKKGKIEVKSTRANRK